MIEFIWPWAGWLLLLPLLIMLLVPRADRDEAALHIPFYQTLLKLDSTATKKRAKHPHKRFLFRFTCILIWCLLVLAAARPTWVGEPIQLPATGRDLMLAVDISGSMKMEDLRLEGSSTSRLNVVKHALTDFISRRKGDRLGLILFGSQAYLQSPLTFDRNAVEILLLESQIGFAGEKTAIGDAIGLSVKRLRNRPENSRLLILLTDGANTAGAIEPLKAAELAQIEKIKIHTIGVGATEMVRGGLFGNRTMNPSADLDEEMLRNIAALTGGNYFRAHNTQELETIYALLDQLEPVDQKEETFSPRQSLYMWPLGIAFILSILLAMYLLYRPYTSRTGRKREAVANA